MIPGGNDVPGADDEAADVNDVKDINNNAMAFVGFDISCNDFIVASSFFFDDSKLDGRWLLARHDGWDRTRLRVRRRWQSCG